MTTVTLSDGTKVAQHYDFNEHFYPLPVHNQEQNPICWYETHASLIEAFYRMYEKANIQLAPGKISHSDEGWQISHWTDLRSNGFGELGTTTFVGGDFLEELPEYKNLSRAEAIAKALWTNGVLEGGVKCQQSFGRLWAHPDKYPEWNSRVNRMTHIPVLQAALPGDLAAIQKNNWAHAVIYVGYRLRVSTTGQILGIDILCQNSWGENFGKKGRCYIGQDLVEKGAAESGYIHSWNEHPPNGLKMPERMT